MSDLKASRARPYGFTLFEAAVLLLLAVGGVLLIRHRMELAQETVIRSAAKAQLLEMGIHVVSAEDFGAVSSHFFGTTVLMAPRLRGDDRRISNNEIDLICLFEEIAALNLDWGYVDDAGLLRLSHLKDLEVLSLACSLISDDGLAVLKNFPELRELNLQYSCVKGPGLRHLKSLPKLERLDLSDNELTDDCVSTLLELKALKKLSLKGTYVSPSRLDELRERGIELFESLLAGLQNGVSAAHDVATLGTDPGMETALAAWKTIQKKAYQADSQLEMMLPPDGRVTCLRVRGARLRQKHLQAIAQISSLRNLDLAVSTFPDLTAMSELNSLLELRRVDLSRTAAHEVLSLNPNWLRRIESLHLRSAGLVDDDLKSLANQFPKLRILDLSGNPISDTAMSSLNDCVHLEELVLSRTKVTPKGIVKLAELPELRRLDLTGTAVGRGDLEELAGKRPHLRVILDAEPDATSASGE